jgi:drug/metabolite transporter (DMT)-like permease
MERSSGVNIPVGTLWAIAAALVSGFSVFVMKFAVNESPDPVAFTLAKNLVAGLLLGGAWLSFGGAVEVRGLTSKVWRRLVLVAVVGGNVPFALFFSGLAITGAGTAAVIQKSLFIWVALLAVVFLKERPGFWQIAGGVLLAAGIVIQSGLGTISFHRGETLILSATLLWAVEAMIAKNVLRSVTTYALGSIRLILGGILLAVILTAQGHVSALMGFGSFAWLMVLVSGVMLATYVGCWLKALQLAPASYVSALLVPASLFTMLLEAIAFSGPGKFTTVTLYIAGTLLIMLPMLLLRRTVPGHEAAC